MSIELSTSADDAGERSREPVVEPGDFVLSFAKGRYTHQLVKRIQGARLRPEHRG